MRYAITGTPGTGKTSVAKVLRERGHEVVDLTGYVIEHGLREEYDEQRDTYDVDVDRLNESLAGMEGVFFEGHLSHFADVDIIIVMRCHPDLLYERLKKRGYPEEKVRENVRAEVLDVILVESVDSGYPTFVVDSGTLSPEGCADAIEDIIKGEDVNYSPRSIDWVEEIDKWF